MALTEKQQKIKKHLLTVAKSSPNATFTYNSELLGFIPFGVVCQLECAGKDVGKELPPGWDLKDVLALVNTGDLQKISEWKNPEEEQNQKITFRLRAA